MKSKYITTLLACLSRPVAKKDIHAELQETIAERNRILQRLQTMVQKAKVIDGYITITKAA